MNISIVPSFLCNGSCEYCYLGNSIHNKETIDLSKLVDRIKEVSKAEGINDFQFDVFGGEICLLDRGYIETLFEMLSGFTTSKIMVTTNLTNFKRSVELLHDKRLMVATSLNDERKKIDFIARKNIMRLSETDRQNLSVLVVVTPSVLQKPIRDILVDLETLKIGGVRFLQYYPSANARVRYDILVSQYESFCLQLIYEYNNGGYSFELLNIPFWKSFKVYSVDNVFVMPNGNFATTQYNNGIESFVEFEDYASFRSYSEREYIEHVAKCSLCPYFSCCLAEHICNEKDCCGLRSISEFLSTHDRYSNSIA